jgi:hypothetical protein
MYANKRHAPAYTGSIPAKASHKEPLAVPGQDGYVAGDDDDAVTGSIGARRTGGVDHEFDLTDSAAAPQYGVVPLHSAGDAAIRAEERNSAFH